MRDPGVIIILAAASADRRHRYFAFICMFFGHICEILVLHHKIRLNLDWLCVG